MLEVVRHAIEDVAQHVCISHEQCPGQLWNIQGAFDVTLDRYQLDELDRVGYTSATETCMFCHHTSLIYIQHLGYTQRSHLYQYDGSQFKEQF
jgi:hypothetical protein